MGYTHYWYREESIDEKTFNKISGDTERVSLASKLPLGDGYGKKEPIFSDDLLLFNGSTNCGHKKDSSIIIPWPTPNAGGVYDPKDTENPVSGAWFAGVKLQTRVCDGNCSYESFFFPRTLEIEQYQKPRNKKYFNFTKTAYRPYDLVVTACLIIAKHYLGSKIDISSDGEAPQWFDGAMLCHTTLGYGLDFQLDPEKETII